jgi:hypothetical protein
MKKIILLLLISFSLKGQTFFEKNDLAFDYYRAAFISTGTSLGLNHLTKGKYKGLCGLSGFFLASLQGFIFERHDPGKIASCMGAVSGQFSYIITLHLKEARKNEIIKIEKYNLKYKPLN